MVVAEQGPVGHHHLHLHRHLDRPGGGFLAGESGDHQVGHQLSAATRVAVLFELVGVAGQRGVGRDSLGDRQEPGQQRHRVRCRPQGHPTVRDGAAAAAQDRPGIQLDRPTPGPPARPRRRRGVRAATRAGYRPGAGPRPTARRSRGPSAVARHSLIWPRDNAARVCGISETRAVANPTWRAPRCGLSRRARATWAATPRPSWPGSASTCDRAKSTVTRACAAAAAPFNSSSNRSWSTRSAVPNAGVQVRQPGDPAAQLRGRQHRPPLRLIPDLHALIRPDGTDSPTPKPRPDPATVDN